MSTFEHNCNMSNGYVNAMKKGLSDSKMDTVPSINKAWRLTGESEMLKTSGAPVPVKGYIKGVPYYNVDFKEYNKTTCCWCNITGHSMEPEINSGDIIALKEIPDFSFIPFWGIYAIVTKNSMRTVKRIGPGSSNEYYMLIPTNKSPEYGIQEIPKSMLLKVYEVLGYMKKL